MTKFVKINFNPKANIASSSNINGNINRKPIAFKPSKKEDIAPIKSVRNIVRDKYLAK